MRLAGVRALCLSTWGFVAAAAFPATPPSHFHLPGDYILGGLFSLHAEVVGKPVLNRSLVPTCKAYRQKLVSYSYLQAMRFAVEEINNSSALLPGISLGYEMVDVCYLTNTVHPILYFLSDKHSVVQLQKNYTYYQPRVLAVIGPDASPAAVTAVSILSLFLVPQISYSATTEDLSSPKAFPVAFRTIPSTEQQITIMLKLLQWFKWNWVAILTSDDDYGQQNLQLLRAQSPRPCIAFQEIIPVLRANQPVWYDIEQQMDKVIAKITHSRAQVVLVLSLELPLMRFFRKVIQHNITGLVWIAAEAWASDPLLHGISGLSGIGTIFGVSGREVPVPGLDDFQVSLSAGPEEGAKGPAETGRTCNQECQECLSTAHLYNMSLRETGDRINFNVYSAVYVIAHALHRLLACDEMGCLKRTVYPWQLLQEVEQVNFSLLNTTFTFDKKGELPNGFEVIQWQWDVPGKPFKKVAYYDSQQRNLHIYEENIVWHTPNNTAPKSNCSEQCGPGQMKKMIGTIACCFECVTCKAGTFLNESDIFDCQKCPQDMWSNPGKQECFMRLETYLRWEDLASLLLLFGSALGFLSTLGILATFVLHSRTPVVKSAGGGLCFVMIISLVISFCSVPFYIGRPTDVTCICRRTIFNLCFTVCLSCITVRSFQIICAFKMAAQLPRAYDIWMKYKGQQLFIAVVFAVKFVIVAANIYAQLPTLVASMLSSNPLLLVLTCSKDYKSTLFSNNILDMVLSCLCFCFAYIGKALPKNYNEAKYITLCMTCYFSSWITVFLVTTTYNGTMVTAFEVLTMLFVLFTISVGYFGPKCYVIFFHPERNTAAFFQTAIQSYTMRQE